MIQKPFGGVFHHLGPTFINAYVVKLQQTWLIETESNMGDNDLPWPRKFGFSECFVYCVCLYVSNIMQKDMSGLKFL